MSKLSFNSEAKVSDSAEKDLNVILSFNKAWTLGYNPWNIVKEMHARGGGVRQFY